MDPHTDILEFPDGPTVREHLTLRKLMERYRDNQGRCWKDAKVPELSISSDTGSISCMVMFPNTMGSPIGGRALVLEPDVLNSAHAVLDCITSWVGECMDASAYWCLPDMREVSSTDGITWSVGTEDVHPYISRCLMISQLRGFSPLSVSTVHAALEAQSPEYRSTYSDVYLFPRTTTPSTGLLGTFHNNLTIDLSPREKDKEPDMEARSFRDEHMGFVCCAHTSHTGEAGRTRRLACHVEVRLLDGRTFTHLKWLSDALPFARESGDHLLYCNGKVAKCTVDQVRFILRWYRTSCMTYDPGFSVYYDKTEKMCFINVSPGVLVKRASNGPWADSVVMHSSDRDSFTVHPKLDTKGDDFKRACLSPFYNLSPYIEQNRAIRTTISSSQTIQAVCYPWCPATAAISPVNIFHPLCTTPLYSSIMRDQDDEDDFASYLPGENLCVLYHNLPMTYEDSIVMSSRYRDMGGFSTLSVCKYILGSSDYVPPPGSVLCSILSPWWKSRCQSHCLHTKDYVVGCDAVDPSGSPTGRVISRRVLATGEQSVRVKSFEQFQTGNKVSTMHGQKGVVTVIPHEDMPQVVMPEGYTIVPDMVVGMSSIIMRQTTGQLYETVEGLETLRSSIGTRIVETGEVSDLTEDFEVIDSVTGDLYQSMVFTPGKDDHRVEVTRATLGYVRVFNQSQMTREKHFTSHKSPGRLTLRTPVRRSKGGGVAWGEMEVQACVAAGLPMCVEELRKRGDEIVVLVCTRCQRLRLLHTCTADTEFVEVSLPYDTVVLDCVNRIVHNTTFKYGIEPDI